MAAKRLVLIGAGMTGRGQVAQLAYEAGWDLTLVDRSAALVERLKEAGQYRVRLLSALPDGSPSAREVVVKDFEVLHTGDSEALGEAICRADLVVTSVIENNLPSAGETLAGAIAARLRAGVQSPLNLIAAENMEHSSSDLQKYVKAHLDAELLPDFEARMGFPNAMISRVVPVAEDPLLIVAEEYSEWTADQNACLGDPPILNGLEWVTNQSARLERKLFIHNTGHVICGYLGWMKGYRYIHEAAQDPEIMAHIQQAVSESGAAISAEHGFPREEVKAYEEHLLGRLVLSALPDDLRRVIRHPLRKLGREERLVGPLLLCEKHHLPIKALCYGIAAVLAGCKTRSGEQDTGQFARDEQSERIRASLEQRGPVETLRDLTGFDARDWNLSEEAAGYIRDAYQQLSNKG